MAKITVHKCDRCGALVEYVETVSGKELCGVCSKQLTEWFNNKRLSTLPRQPHSLNLPYGTRQRQVMELINRDGHTRPAVLAEYAGISVEYAYTLLGVMCKKGVLARSSDGKAVYVKASDASQS